MASTDFLSIRDFTPEQIRHFLHVACQVKAKPEHFAGALKGKTLAMIFEKPSLRTRVTFDVGMEQLGGHSLYLSPAEINLGKVLPAMGYSEIQRHELEETIRRTPCDVVLVATPIDLARAIRLDKPNVRVRYEVEEIGRPAITELLEHFAAEYKPAAVPVGR